MDSHSIHGQQQQTHHLNKTSNYGGQLPSFLSRSCKDRSSGYSSFFGLKQPGSKFVDHTSLLEQGSIKQFSMYFNTEERCLQGAKAVFGHPGGASFRGAVGNSAKATERAFMLSPDEAIVRVDYKVGKCIEYIRVFTNRNRTAAVGTLDSSAKPMVAKPLPPDGRLVAVRGFQGPDLPGGRSGTLQQLQLLWGYSDCSGQVVKKTSAAPAAGRTAVKPIKATASSKPVQHVMAIQENKTDAASPVPSTALSADTAAPAMPAQPGLVGLSNLPTTTSAAEQPAASTTETRASTVSTASVPLFEPAGQEAPTALAMTSTPPPGPTPDISVNKASAVAVASTLMPGPSPDIPEKESPTVAVASTLMPGPSPDISEKEAPPVAVASTLMPGPSPDISEKEAPTVAVASTTTPGPLPDISEKEAPTVAVASTTTPGPSPDISEKEAPTVAVASTTTPGPSPDMFNKEAPPVAGAPSLTHQPLPDISEKETPTVAGASVPTPGPSAKGTKQKKPTATVASLPIFGPLTLFPKKKATTVAISSTPSFATPALSTTKQEPTEAEALKLPFGLSALEMPTAALTYDRLQPATDTQPPADPKEGLPDKAAPQLQPDMQDTLESASAFNGSNIESVNAWMTMDRDQIPVAAVIKSSASSAGSKDHNQLQGDRLSSVIKQQSYGSTPSAQKLLDIMMFGASSAAPSPAQVPDVASQLAHTLNQVASSTADLSAAADRITIPAPMAVPSDTLAHGPAFPLVIAQPSLQNSGDALALRSSTNVSPDAPLPRQSMMVISDTGLRTSAGLELVQV
eukprot:gene8488-8670_t